MNLREIESLLKDMSNGMDNKIDNIDNKATSTQERIFALLIAEIDKFEIENVLIKKKYFENHFETYRSGESDYKMDKK